MSLVGPRPLVVDEDVLIEGWQRRRLTVKPGMTGLWQIFGSSRIPMPEMVKIDYMYGANWSIWLDMKNLLRTVPYMLRRRGFKWCRWAGLFQERCQTVEPSAATSTPSLLIAIKVGAAPSVDCPSRARATQSIRWIALPSVTMRSCRRG